MSGSSVVVVVHRFVVTGRILVFASLAWCGVCFGGDLCHQPNTNLEGLFVLGSHDDLIWAPRSWTAFEIATHSWKTYFDRYLTKLGPPVWVSGRKAEMVLSLPTPDVGSALFALFLQQRLWVLGTDQKVAVDGFLKQHTEIVETPGFVGGRTVIGDRGYVIRLFLPNGFRNTLLEFALKAHELEHVLQRVVPEATWLSSQGKEKGPVLLRSFVDAVLYENTVERFAIWAEWAYLHSVPEAMRAQALATLDLTGLEGISRDFVTRTLKNASMPFESFLAAEKNVGRYSLPHIISRSVQMFADHVGFVSDGVAYSDFRPVFESVSEKEKQRIVVLVQSNAYLNAEEKSRFLKIVYQLVRDQ